MRTARSLTVCHSCSICPGGCVHDMHAPRPCTHPPQPRMLPGNHACPHCNHACPPHNHACPPTTMHAPHNHTCPPPQPCMPPPPTTMYAPPQPCMPPHNHVCPQPYMPPCGQNHRCLWKYNLAPTSLWAVITHANSRAVRARSHQAKAEAKKIREARMHSSRMRTARSLPYGGLCRGGLCPGGSLSTLSRVLCPGGLCLWGSPWQKPLHPCEQNDRHVKNYLAATSLLAVKMTNIKGHFGFRSVWMGLKVKA